jgi:hypothetical protein
MLVSPYLKQGTGYGSFIRGWRFPWEVEHRVQLPESEEEREALVKKALFNHQRILDKVKKDKHDSGRT